MQELLSSNASIIAIEKALKKAVDQFLVGIKQTTLYNYSDRVAADEFIKREKTVETQLNNLITIYFNFGRWANNTQIKVIVSQFERIAIPQNPEDTFHPTWENLSRYPGLLLLYAVGLGAVLNDNTDILHAILNVKIHNRINGENEPVWHLTSVFRVFRDFKDLTKSNRYTPGSDELFNYFKRYFEDVPEEKYEDLFNLFEYLLTLLYGAWELKEKKEGFWVPIGSYIWRIRRGRVWEITFEKFKTEGKNWIFFRCFDSDKSSLESAFTVTNDYISKNQSHYVV